MESQIHEMEKDMAQLTEENERLRQALAEIAKGEGAFSRDPLTHASNTIDNMKRLAEQALLPNDQARARRE